MKNDSRARKLKKNWFQQKLPFIYEHGCSFAISDNKILDFITFCYTSNVWYSFFPVIETVMADPFLIHFCLVFKPNFVSFLAQKECFAKVRRFFLYMLTAFGDKYMKLQKKLQRNFVW